MTNTISCSKGGTKLLAIGCGWLILRIGLKRSIILGNSMLAIQAAISVVFFPLDLILISKITDLDQRSPFTGAAVAFGVIIGNGVTTFVLGAVADAWSFKAGIFILSILTALSCVLLRRLPDA